MNKINLRKLREERGLTQKEVAEKISKIKLDNGKILHPSPQKVWDWENKIIPLSVNAAKCFSKIYNLNWKDFF